MRRLRPTPVPIDDGLWRGLADDLPWLPALAADRAQRLRALAGSFLHRKRISPVSELQLDDRQRLLLATLCCLPLMEYGENGLSGWSQLIVYPDAFRVHRSHVDAAGVLHEWDDELVGESWEQGPLILSWADVQADLAEPHAGFCVAVHEMAHKLDVLDGALDGTPLLPRDWQRVWARDFQQAYDALCRVVDHGREPLIDAYASEAPEEFFAVVSEYHFSAPKRLRRAMPKVAAHLERFYGPSPLVAHLPAQRIP